MPPRRSQEQVKKINSVTKEDFDRNCIEFMKIGALPQIQSRLFQRNPKSFARAIKTAIEAIEETGRNTTRANIYYTSQYHRKWG